MLCALSWSYLLASLAGFIPCTLYCVAELVLFLSWPGEHLLQVQLHFTSQPLCLQDPSPHHWLYVCGAVCNPMRHVRGSTAPECTGDLHAFSPASSVELLFDQITGSSAISLFNILLIVYISDELYSQNPSRIKLLEVDLTLGISCYFWFVVLGHCFIVLLSDRCYFPRVEIQWSGLPRRL